MKNRCTIISAYTLHPASAHLWAHSDDRKWRPVSAVSLPVWACSLSKVTDYAETVRDELKGEEVASISLQSACSDSVTVSQPNRSRWIHLEGFRQSHQSSLKCKIFTINWVKQQQIHLKDPTMHEHDDVLNSATTTLMQPPVGISLFIFFTSYFTHVPDTL